jgi:hypothetical protein
MRVRNIVITLLLVFAVGVGAAAGQYNLYVPRDPAFPIVMLVVNGEPKLPDVPPMVIDGRTMVPLRFLAELFGAEVGWDPNAYIVTVDFEARESEPERTYQPSLAPQEKKEPEIVGSSQFVQTIRQALNLLLEKDLQGYLLVCGYLNSIQEAPHTGVNEIEAIAYRSLPNYPQDLLPLWEAGSLVHEAVHVWLQRKGYQVAGKESEVFCGRAQKETLVKVGAPAWMIEGVDKSMETRYWEVPYEQRNW